MFTNYPNIDNLNQMSMIGYELRVRDSHSKMN